MAKRFLDSSDASIVVVAAPAGYGKSTAVQLWDEVDDRQFVWVHLDPADDDPVQFLRHIAASMHQVAALDPAIVRVLTGPGRPIDTDMIPALGSTMAARIPFVLVVDDVHYLQSDATLRALESVLSYLPAGSQLALVGRSMPELHLAKRRLDGHVAEFGAEDLVMGLAEASSLLARADVVVSDHEVQDLVDRTEGWPAGLGLACLALRQNRERGWIATFSGSDRVVGDYLVEEVLGGLDDRTTDFLLRSSVLDRLNEAMLVELFDDPDAAAVLHDLERSANPFLVPLDPSHEWFRYHHLFAEMLRARFERDRPDDFRRAHSTMSIWFERRGDADRALRHAVAAGEIDRASDLVLANALAMIDEGRLGQLGQWLDLLGPEQVDRHPAAAVASAWFGVATLDPTVMMRSIRAAEALHWEGPLPDGSPSLEVAVAAVRAMVAAEGTDGVLRDTAIVLAGGGPTVNRWWGFATALRGTVATLEGDHARARDLLNAGLANIADSPSFEAGYLGILALLDVYEGDPADAERHARRATDLCTRYNLEGVILVVAAYAAGALVAARAGRADEAHEATLRARRLLARLGDVSPRTGLRCHVALAQAALTLGEYGDARVFAKDAARARTVDPSCAYLNGLLDEVEQTLARVGRDVALNVAPISSAEWRVLTYLPTHLSLQEIATTVHLSRNTVKSHALAIYRKLGVTSRAEAVAEALRLGLLAPGATSPPFDGPRSVGHRARP